MFKFSYLTALILGTGLMLSCNTLKSAINDPDTSKPVASASPSVATSATITPGKEVKMRELDKVATSQIQEAKKVVVKDQTTLQALWKEHMGVEEGVPKVDFSKEMVLAVFMGEKRTGGFSIEVTKATLNGKDLVVEVTETKPDPSLFVIQIITAPAQWVAVEKVEGKVTFEVKEKIGK